jgi:hypothetical protein
MAAGSTYTPLATTTLGSSSATISFTSISSAYTDIVAVISGTASATNEVKLRVNNLSTSIYSSTIFAGDGSTASSYRNTAGSYGATGNNLPTSGTGNFIINFQNYSNATTNKTYLSRGNLTTSVSAAAGLIQLTSAINRIDFLFDTAATFSTGTTITLYGIVAA